MPDPRRAVILTSAYDIRVPDALQIAAASEACATIFLTNDYRLRQVQELELLPFDSVLP